MPNPLAQIETCGNCGSEIRVAGTWASDVTNQVRDWRAGHLCVRREALPDRGPADVGQAVDLLKKKG